MLECPEIGLKATFVGRQWLANALTYVHVHGCVVYYTPRSYIICANIILMLWDSDDIHVYM